ncbi:MAG: hypothetical protein ACOYKZ_03485 [Chlamydiia bacterium]
MAKICWQCCGMALLAGGLGLMFPLGSEPNLLPEPLTEELSQETMTPVPESQPQVPAIKAPPPIRTDAADAVQKQAARNRQKRVKGARSNASHRHPLLPYSHD